MAPEIKPDGEYIDIGEAVPSNAIMNLSDSKPPKYRFRDAKEDMMYELIILDYDKFQKENDAKNWIIGYKADIPGAELKKGYEDIFPTDAVVGSGERRSNSKIVRLKLHCLL